MESIEAIEMYLKGILKIQTSENRLTKPIELAEYLNVTKATVSEMLRKLQDSSLVEYESYKGIHLTQKGRRKAEKVMKKYEVIKLFLTEVLKIEVDDEQAHNEACKLEHDFSEASIEKLDKLLPKLKKAAKS